MIVVAHWFLRKWWCAMNWHSGKDKMRRSDDDVRSGLLPVGEAFCC